MIPFYNSVNLFEMHRSEWVLFNDTVEDQTELPIERKPNQSTFGWTLLPLRDSPVWFKR